MFENDLVDPTGDEQVCRDGVADERYEQRLPQDTSDDSDNDIVPQIEPALDCLLNNSFFMSEFDGDKFLKLSETVMERVLGRWN